MDEVYNPQRQMVYLLTLIGISLGGITSTIGGISLGGISLGGITLGGIVLFIMCGFCSSSSPFPLFIMPVLGGIIGGLLMPGFTIPWPPVPKKNK